MSIFSRFKPFISQVFGGVKQSTDIVSTSTSTTAVFKNYAHDGIQRFGCNLTGGDSFWQEWTNPSQIGSNNYLFVDKVSDLLYLNKSGMKIYRLLFTWEAVQSGPDASLDGSYYLQLLALVQAITNSGNICLLDIHGGDPRTFAAYRSVKVGQKYNGTNVSDMLVNLWWQLGKKFAGNPLVWFGITNEPTPDISVTDWYACAQNILWSVRNAGSTNTIVMPGTAWTSPSTWLSSGNGDAFAKLRDPANNLMAQVHLYFDRYAGGGATDIVSDQIGVQRLNPVIQWSKQTGIRAMVAEMGLSAVNALSPKTLENTMGVIKAHPEVFSGVCWWAYGPPAWWGNYQFTLCQQNGLDSPQMKLYKQYL